MKMHTDRVIFMHVIAHVTYRYFANSKDFHSGVGQNSKLDSVCSYIILKQTREGKYCPHFLFMKLKCPSLMIELIY